MQAIFSFVRADAVAGPGAAGLNLIVASALVTLSLMLCAVVSLLAGLPALVGGRCAQSPREETKVRHTFVRSMRGHAQGEFVVPWRGYVLWVGGTLPGAVFRRGRADATAGRQPLLQRVRKNADDPNPFRGEGT